MFLAAKAKELGLIDELSNYENAKKELEKLANVSNPVWKEEDKIDKFLNRLEGQTSSLISKSLIEIVYKTNSSFISAR